MTPPCAKMVSLTMSTVGFFDSSRAMRPPAEARANQDLLASQVGNCVLYIGYTWDSMMLCPQRCPQRRLKSTRLATHGPLQTRGNLDCEVILSVETRSAMAFD